MSNPLYTKGEESRIPTVCLSHLLPLIEDHGYLSIQITDFSSVNTPEGIWQLDGSITYNNPAWAPLTGFAVTENNIDLDQPATLFNGSAAFLTLVSVDLDHVFYLTITDPNGGEENDFFSIRQLLKEGGLI